MGARICQQEQQQQQQVQHVWADVQQETQRDTHAKAENQYDRRATLHTHAHTHTYTYHIMQHSYTVSSATHFAPFLPSVSVSLQHQLQFEVYHFKFWTNDAN